MDKKLGWDSTYMIVVQSGFTAEDFLAAVGGCDHPLFPQLCIYDCKALFACQASSGEQLCGLPH